MKQLLLVILSLTLLTSCRYQRDAEDTLFEEVKVSTLLKKYEHFKDLSAGIDRKRADIEMYQSEIASMNSNDKDDKFYIQQRKSELFGLISIHNSLCADYNSAMSKINYRFTNVGDLPATNLEPLPREIKPYINNLKRN
jgi:hypothetical protein